MTTYLQTFTINQTEILTAAIQGLEAQREGIEQHIRACREMLNPPSVEAVEVVPVPVVRKQRKKISVAARKRMAAAQKARWAKYRGLHG